MADTLDFNIFNSIILAGIMQGFVFGIVVASTPKYHSKATLYLTALIVVFSLNNLQYYLQDTGIISSRLLFSVAFVPYQMLGGPLLLYYGHGLLHRDRPLGKKKLLLLPFAFFVLLSTSFKIAIAAGIYDDQLRLISHYLYAGMEFLAILFDQAIVLYLLWQLLRQQKNSESPNQPLKWFNFILITFFLLSFVWLYIAVLSFVHDVKNAYYTLWIAMSFMIYWLGHTGIYRFAVETERKNLRNFSIDSKAAATPVKAKSGYTEILVNMIVNEKRYLDPNLTLDKLAEELNLSKSHLSRIFNSELKMSFPEYINSLRVEAAKSYLSNAEFSDYTLVAIGLEAGFNSKTTFNNAFKKATGMTPSDYKNSCK